MWFAKKQRWFGPSLESNNQGIDRGMLSGGLLAAVLFALAIGVGGNVLQFFDIPSFFIVFGGTFGAALINFSPQDMRSSWESFKSVLFERDYHPTERIDYLCGLSQKVRQDGLLCLEPAAKRSSDPFLKLALELTVDGQQHDDVRRMLETEMRAANDRAWRAIQVFEAMGAYAPAMGLVGTLIGLIQMLGTLNQPEKVGPAMAVALITTLYGALLANLVFLPIAGKLKNRKEEESLVKVITIEGAMSLGKQENPMIIEQRLQRFLPKAAHE